MSQTEPGGTPGWDIWFVPHVTYVCRVINVIIVPDFNLLAFFHESRCFSELSLVVQSAERAFCSL